MSLSAFLVKALDAPDLDDDVNRFVIDGAVTVAPHPAAPPDRETRLHLMIGLTERTDNARLLPAKFSPSVEACQSRDRYPLDEVDQSCQSHMHDGGR